MKVILISLIVFLIILPVKMQSQQLVLPGDYPDPSVVKIGDTYWASATTSNWFPAFPLLFSKDLVHWQQKGFVLNQMPSWADYYFWAPEITHEKGRTYVYYAAHKKGGNLCLGVASAENPEGPYTDHGPLMCQEAGSIDAFPMRDVDGKLYLIWKEDGNSVGKPTPIWAMQMNEERTALLGEKKELFRNTEKWEGNLVEGVSMMKHGDYYYAFYAGAGCCGTGCNYAGGIARAKNLLGPWEKYNQNPLLSNTQSWVCPGHGTPIEKDGKYYFLYHAYDKNSHVFSGRQGMLIEFKFTPDQWISFITSPVGSDISPAPVFDSFDSKSLSDHWQWDVSQNTNYQINQGALHLPTSVTGVPVFLGQKAGQGKYTATTQVRYKKTNAAAGIGAIGDIKNMLTASIHNRHIEIIQRKDGIETRRAQSERIRKKNVFLRMKVENGKDFYFLYSLDGKLYKPLNENAIDGSYLPPWDRAVRAGLIAMGAGGKKAIFNSFEIIYD